MYIDRRLISRKRLSLRNLWVETSFDLPSQICSHTPHSSPVSQEIVGSAVVDMSCAPPPSPSVLVLISLPLPLKGGMVNVILLFLLSLSRPSGFQDGFSSI